MEVKFYGVSHFSLEETIDFPNDATPQKIEEVLRQWLVDNIYDYGYKVLEASNGN